MASSKKPSRANETQPGLPIEIEARSIFHTAVLQALTPASPLGQHLSVPRIAVAYSGGADSTVLLHTLAQLHNTDQVQAIAFHIHHGLSPHADAWLAHCQEQCAALQIPLHSQHISLHLQGGKSLEAVARQARYAALERLCLEHDVHLLMTAHHADDQAETILLNLLRGSGIAGLAGVAAQRPLQKGDQSNASILAKEVLLLRPFKSIESRQIRQHAQTQSWSFIEDESNLDRRHTRNALRHEVMPILKRIFPSTNQRFAQTAAHALEAQTLLDAIGQDDLDSMAHEGELDIDGLRTLSRPRAANALRLWFRSQGLPAPNTVALGEMLRQLLESKPDGQIQLMHEDLALQVFRGRLVLTPNDLAAGPLVELQWRSEAMIEVPQWHGRLLFTATSGRGLNDAWLCTTPLSLRPRQGGERLKLDDKRPSRSLKNLYQEHAIAPWQRHALPLLYAEDQLIFAAGLGMDVRHLCAPAQDDVVTVSTGSAIIVSWEARP